jgi:hypothetical protein
MAFNNPYPLVDDSDSDSSTSTIYTQPTATYREAYTDPASTRISTGTMKGTTTNDEGFSPPFVRGGGMCHHIFVLALPILPSPYIHIGASIARASHSFKYLLQHLHYPSLFMISLKYHPVSQI